MGKQCRGCVFNTKQEKCKIFHERIENCWAKADKEEYKRRKADMEAYKERFEIKSSSNHTSSKEKLESGFLELYQQGFHDTTIAKKLDVAASTVGKYRNKLGLPYHNKKKPAGTGK